VIQSKNYTNYIHVMMYKICHI